MSLFVFGRSSGVMNTVKVLRPFLCAILGGVALHAHAQVDVVAGSPVYSAPLSVPPGVGGMVPQLALEFNGGNSAGALGWAIKGVSQITRCPSNKLIDGQSRGVSFSQSDRLCLDGQRLIQTDANGAVKSVQQDDSLGGDGAVREYRTETDSFARVRAYGVAGGNAANGPAYFKVWTKNGRVLEYGPNSNPTSNSQIAVQGKGVIATWVVSRISDAKGNYTDFQYSQRDVASGSAVDGAVIPGREWALSEIRYTGNGQQAPANKVVFEYTERSGLDRSESFHQGSKAVGIWLLSKIKTYAGNVAVKTLWFTYETGPVSRRSRPKQIKECAGDSSSQKCLPPTTFNYKAESAPLFTVSPAFKNSSLATTALSTATGTRGVLIGNFFGNGRTDMLRWSDSPSENELYRSNGDGSFTKTGTGISSNLYKSDGCYSSVVADFNGDGLSDILRIMVPYTPSGVSCGTVSNLLFFANGDGTFTVKGVGLDFTQKLAKVTHYMACADSMMSAMSTKTSSSITSGTASTGSTTSTAPIPANHEIATPSSTSTSTSTPTRSGTTALKSSSIAIGGGSMSPSLQYCPGGMQDDGTTSQTAGRTYHLIDVDNDGLLDVLTTDLPGYSRTPAPPDEATQCAGKVCTRLYKQQADGTFVETTTNLASRSVYTDPPTVKNTYWRRLDQVDVNGDKFSDLVVDSGVWISRGDGNFDSNGFSWQVQGCQHPIDFNGDDRVDCLPTSFNSATYQSIYVANGQAMQRVSNFNLTQAGQELLELSTDATKQMTGISIADVDGDGRGDIIRWKDDPNQNAVYLSNGDGSFTVSNGFGLPGIPLQKSDGTYAFVTGDFTGNGNVEVLRLRADPTGASDALSNVLYVKAGATPPDQLSSVVTGTGLSTRFTWVSLSNSASGVLGDRYSSDRLKASKASYPVVDMKQPMYVVATSTIDDVSGSIKEVTEFSYAGLKGTYDGRGNLGFRETREQTTAPNGEAMTEVTQYLQSGLYVGKPSVIEMRRGALNNDGAQVLSRTTSIYCDTTSLTPDGQDATKDSPCTTTAKVRRPYLYRSIQESWDLNRVALPVTTTTNTANENGDLLKVVVNRTGTPAGLPAQSSTRTVSNVYYANNIANDNWLLGQLQRSTVSSAVPNSIDSIVTTAPAPLPPPGTPAPAPAPTTPSVPVSTWLPAVLSILLDD
jgi:hypothetical protein